MKPASSKELSNFHVSSKKLIFFIPDKKFAAQIASIVKIRTSITTKTMIVDTKRQNVKSKIQCQIFSKNCPDIFH